MVIILLGPPGVGKGTQAKMLIDATGMRHISTGDLLRAARREGTPLGREAQAFMDAGELVPDDVIMGMVAEVLADTPADQGIIFDGFPRTSVQAQGLVPVLDRVGRTVGGVVVLDAGDDVIVKRLAGRRSCEDCGTVFNVHFTPSREDGTCDRCAGTLVQREDDRPATVQNRLDVYRALTQPLIKYYEDGRAPVWTVAGDGAAADVAAAVLAAVESQSPHAVEE